MIGKKGGKVMRKKGFGKKFLNHLASLALIAGVISSSTACRFVLHQPAMPDKMKKLLGEK